MRTTLLEGPEIEVQDIDHLGIVAGIVDEIGIIELINELISSFEKIAHDSKSGRPVKDDASSSYTYRIVTALTPHNVLIAKLQRVCGGMVLATHLPKEETYSPDYILLIS